MTAREYYKALLSLIASVVLYTNLVNAQIDSTLFNAIKNCDIQKLQTLKPGIDINATDNHGANAMMWAAYYCDIPMMKYLVSLGAKIPEKAVLFLEDGTLEIPGFGSLQSIAAQKGKLALLQYLSDTLGLPLNQCCYNSETKLNDGLSPMSWAISAQRLDMINYLLEKEKIKIGASADRWIQTLKEFATKEKTSLTADQKVQLQKLFLEIANAYFGEDHINYGRALSGAGYLYYGLARYDDAIKFLEQGLGIYGKKQDQTLEQAIHIQNLAAICNQQARYDKSLSLYEKALAMIKQSVGEEHRLYPVLLGNLSDVYTTFKQFDKSITLMQRAIAIRKKTVGENHPLYANSLSRLGATYNAMGLFDVAVPLFQKCLQIQKTSIGEEHDDYLNSLTGISSSYYNLKNYDKAIPIQEQLLVIREKKIGKDHPVYAQSLTNLAMSYYKIRAYDKGLPLIQQATEIFNKRNGKNHPNSARALATLGSFFLRTNQNDKAILLYEDVSAIVKNIYGEEHPDYAVSLLNLSNSYWKANRPGDALPMLIKTSAINLKNLNRQYSTLSETEKVTLAYTSVSNFDFFSSFLFENHIGDPAGLIQLYNNELLLKGMALQHQMDVLKSIRSSGDSAALGVYDLWKTNYQFIARQMTLPLRSRVPYLDSLKEVNNEREQILSRISATFQNEWQIRSVNATTISKTLAGHEAVIEFLRV